MTLKSSDLAISHCINYVLKHQRPDGSLDALSAGKDFSRGTIRNPTFITSLALCALGRAKKTTTVKQIAENGAAFLMTNRSKAWSWNYWPREAEETETKPYPDDLDDTALALAALTPHLSAKNCASALAAFTKLLISAEERPGGPYATWLVPAGMKEAWHDVDPGVNANIAYCLGLHAVGLPALERYLEEKILAGDFESRYYRSPLPVLYFMSRAYEGEAKVKACEYLLSLRSEDGLWGNLMDTSLAVSALMNWGASPSEVISSILHLVKAAYGNAWMPHPLYLEEDKGEKVWCGSAALTAAFAAEALTLYAAARDKRAKNAAQDLPLPKVASALRTDVLARVRERTARCSPRFREALRVAIDQVLANDPEGQIILLPYYWNEAVKGSGVIERKLLVELGALNLMGWVAYRVYDDILDDEGEPALLPLANLLLREVVGTYQKILPKSEYLLFTEIMDALEEANRWERDNCRLRQNEGTLLIGRAPDYGTHDALAEKSLAHAMGPVAILERLGHGRESRATKQTLAFFRHYLIARQLNDDAHDWVRDLGRGFMNSASAKTVRDWSKKDKRKTVTSDLALILPDLQRTFWRTTIVEIGGDILWHVKKAREALSANKLVREKGAFERMLAPLEEAARKALKERKETMEFLKHYA